MLQNLKKNSENSLQTQNSIENVEKNDQYLRKKIKILPYSYWPWGKRGKKNKPELLSSGFFSPKFT